MGERVRTVAVWWSATGLVVSLLVAILSYIPVVPPLPIWLPITCLVGFFPVFGAALVATRRRGFSLQGAELVRRLPPWIFLIPAFAFASFFTAMAGLPGTPEIHHGQYYFDDHGGLIPTTLAGYQRGLRAQQRVFSAVPAVFYAVAYGIHRLGRDLLGRRPENRVPPD